MSKSFRLLALSGLLAAVAFTPSFGQCPGGRCGVPSYQPAVQTCYQWRPFADGDATQIALMHNGLQVGVWKFDPPGFYPMLRAIDASGRAVTEWGCKRDAPIDPPSPPACWKGSAPCVAPSSPADWQTHGVQRENVPAKGMHYRCPGWCDSCGPDCPACSSGGACGCHGHSNATPAAPDAGIPDYAGMPALTVICADPAKRQKVLDDLNTSPCLAGLKAKFGARARAYAPGHFHLTPFKLDADQRFAASGFAIAIQGAADKDGKATPTLLYSYEGPEQLAGVLRDVDPSYDPNRVPAGSPNLLNAAVENPAAATSGILGLVATAFAIFTRRTA